MRKKRSRIHTTKECKQFLFDVPMAPSNHEEDKQNCLDVKEWPPNTQLPHLNLKLNQQLGEFSAPRETENISLHSCSHHPNAVVTNPAWLVTVGSVNFVMQWCDTSHQMDSFIETASCFMSKSDCTISTRSSNCTKEDVKDEDFRNNHN